MFLVIVFSDCTEDNAGKHKYTIMALTWQQHVRVLMP